MGAQGLGNSGGRWLYYLTPSEEWVSGGMEELHEDTTVGPHPKV